MRELTFVVEPGVGPGEVPQRGSLADLVLALPYVAMDAIPPRRVLNDVLRRGRLDAGMSGGCLWEPFAIDEAEYAQLVAELRRAGKEAGDAPDSVRTYSQWVEHRFMQRTGEPLPGGAEEEQAPPSYDEWLYGLPVPDLYLGYLDSRDSEWRTRPDDALGLPPELVRELRRLAELRDEWLAPRGDPTSAEQRAWLSRWVADLERVGDDIRARVDELGLPRWPYAREQA